MDEEFERRMREAAEKMLRQRMPNGELPKVADALPKGDGACIDVFRWTDEADMFALGAIDARDYAEMLVDERPIVRHGRAIGRG